MTEPNPADHDLLALKRNILLAVKELTVATDQHIDQISENSGIYRTDLQALEHLARFARQGVPVTPGRLGAALHLSSPATTALVDRLDRAGHVERGRSTTDRRQVQISRTDHAQSTARALFAPLTAALMESIDEYSTEELLIVARFLESMIEAIHRAQVQAASDADS